MKQETIKLELIEWLAKLNDSDTIQYLKKLKTLWQKTRIGGTTCLSTRKKAS